LAPKGKIFDLVQIAADQKKVSKDFKDLTKWMVGMGRWSLPPVLEIEGIFEDLTYLMVEKLKASDKNKLFWKPVTTQQYVEKISNPMNLEMLVDKVQAGGYEGTTNSEKIGYVHDDMLVMIANCILFHDDFLKCADIIEEGMRVYSSLPEIFASSVLSKIGEVKAGPAPPLSTDEIKLTDVDDFTKLGRFVAIGGSSVTGGKGDFFLRRVRGVVVEVGEDIVKGQVKVAIGGDVTWIEQRHLAVVA